MLVLVVDDDEVLRLSLRLSLEAEGFEVEEACDGKEAVECFESRGHDVVLLDINMPRLSGIEALRMIKERSPRTLCLMLTAHSAVKDAVDAIKLGAYDYLEKPVDPDRIVMMIRRALKANEMVEEIAHSAPQLSFAKDSPIIGSSQAISQVFAIIYKLARVETSVLIRGESGTGKELIARALHHNSHRKKGPFVAVNCAAIPETLIESEFFGHEKGAFTGAERKKIGKFQYAEGGTIFLDEIGDISLAMQVKLLRVLQDKSFTPVGGISETRVDVRIVAATHRPLEEMIKQGKFRDDLFYRLNVLPVHLPPLRKRRDDIPPLVDALIGKFNRRHDRHIIAVSPRAMQALLEHDWPGNIRELENVIEHAFIMESEDTISMSALPPSFGVARVYCPPSKDLEPSKRDLDFPSCKEEFERNFIVGALKAFGGRINQTALHTKMTKVTLLRKLQKYGINPREYHR